MRIAYDPQIFCAQTYGGISRYYVNLADQLIHLGEQVRVFAPLYRNHYLSVQPSDRVEGRYLQRFPTGMAPVFRVLNQLVVAPRLRRWRPDVIHETYFSRLPAGPAGVPVVLTVYDMIRELFPGSFPVWNRTASAKKAAIMRADRILCISESTKRDLLSMYSISEEKVSVVYLGCDLAVTHEVPTLNVPPYLLFVGNRGGYKNFEGMLRGVASSAQLRNDYDVMAFGGGPFGNNERQLISRLGLTPSRVRQVSGNDALLRQYYAGAAAFVYPSLYEGFGFPPLEAMAARCPVVSSNTSSMPEVIGDAAEFFDPGSVDSIRYAIEQVVYSKERTSALIAAGEKRLSVFSWERCAQETLAQYRKAVG